MGCKVLVDIAKTQDDEVGDGTTSVVVLCGELLRCVFFPKSPCDKYPDDGVNAGHVAVVFLNLVCVMWLLGKQSNW